MDGIRTHHRKAPYHGAHEGVAYAAGTQPQTIGKDLGRLPVIAPRQSTQQPSCHAFPVHKPTLAQEAVRLQGTLLSGSYIPHARNADRNALQTDADGTRIRPPALKAGLMVLPTCTAYEADLGFHDPCGHLGKKMIKTSKAAGQADEVPLRKPPKVLDE